MLSLAQTGTELTRACGSDPDGVCRRTFESTGNADAASILSFLVDQPLKILLLILAGFVITRVVRRSIKKGLRRLSSGTVGERLGRRKPAALTDTGELSQRSEQRIEALASVLRSATSVVVWVMVSFMVLGEIGVNLGPLIAGAGIVGVALGFGSQSLVRDFLTGMFILIEDQFGVGDIVDLGVASGTVTAVSLRTTRLRAVDGTVWHVPNGEILRVGNSSQHWSRALLDIEVGYATDITHARDTIKRVVDRVWAESDETVLEEPEVWGVEQLGPSGVLIRVVLKTVPAKQYAISRIVRERIKAAFDEEGIEIPFPQQTMWMRTDTAEGQNGQPVPEREKAGVAS